MPACERCGIEGPVLVNSRSGPACSVCQLCAEAISRETGEWIQLGPRVITPRGYAIAQKWDRIGEADSDPALACEMVAMRRIAMRLAAAKPTVMDCDVLVCALCRWVVGYRDHEGREHQVDCPVLEAIQYAGTSEQQEPG